MMIEEKNDGIFTTMTEVTLADNKKTLNIKNIDGKFVSIETKDGNKTIELKLATEELLIALKVFSLGDKL